VLHLLGTPIIHESSVRSNPDYRRSKQRVLPRNERIISDIDDVILNPRVGKGIHLATTQAKRMKAFTLGYYLHSTGDTLQS
jgi:hypothetical protein